MCNANCINTEIDKISVGELFHVILFSSNQATMKYFDHKKSGTVVYKLNVHIKNDM